MLLPWQCFCQGALGQNFQFFVKNVLFLAQNLFISNFVVQIRNQRLRIDPCGKFQPDWTKDKGTRISTSNDTKNCLMTSANFLWLLRDFVPEYYYAKFGINWTTNKEKQRRHISSLYDAKIPQPQ